MKTNAEKIPNRYKKAYVRFVPLRLAVTNAAGVVYNPSRPGRQREARGPMGFEPSAKTKELQARLQKFMDAHVYPNERRFEEEVARNRWKPTRIVEELKPKARAEGLWNLFLPQDPAGAGLTNLEYAPLCEIMGRSHMAPEIFNCSAPDTGNMEVLGALWHGGAERKVAEAVAGWGNSLVLCDDGAGRGVVGCDEHCFTD